MIRRVRSLAVSDQYFGRLVVALVSLGFLALVAAVVAALWLQVRNQQHLGWVEHTYSTQALIERFGTLHERVETSRRGYLIDGEQSFRLQFDGMVSQVPDALSAITVLTRDNPSQQRRVAAIGAIMVRQQELQRRSMALISGGGRNVAVREFARDQSVPMTRAIRRIVEAMKHEEANLLARRTEVLRRSTEAFYWVLAGAGLILLVVAISTIATILRYTRDLNASRDALRTLNEDLEGAVQKRTGELQRANDEIQRFAYIVSHDLRSPLVNVMGFTAELDAARKPIGELLDRIAAEHPELISKDAELAVREDLPESIGFIRTSTQKMDRLINAILRLSREGRRTVTPERIDVAAMLQGVSDNLQHRVTELGAEIVLAPDLPGIVSDRFALEQIFSNLVENAVKYLQPGRPGQITVSGTVDRDRIRYEVADNGRGIDPRDHERVFDLFRRSGQQDQPGEGIGLAHVRALAYRIGGVIDVRSQLDQGATFRLSLPAKFELLNKVEAIQGIKP